MTSSPDTAGARRRFRELSEESPERAARMLAAAHPADAALFLLDAEEENARRAFAELTPEEQAAVLEQADEGLTQTLTADLSPHALKEIVEELPSDEAVDVLAEIDEGVVEDVLDSLEAEDAEELRVLRSYDPESAGGVMTTDFVTVPADAHVLDAVKALKREGEDDEEGLGVFVVDAAGHPVGYLSEHALLSNPVHDQVSEVMTEPYLVGVDEDQETAASILHRYDLQALGVVDVGGVLVGVISQEDARDVLEEEFTEDLHRMVGTGSEQQTRLPILRRVRQRMPLMVVTVIGGLASAKLMALLTPSGASTAGGSAGEMQAVLRYLPLIIGLAGNVGVQSSTILVRAFATQEVGPERELSVLGSEVMTGTLIGLICGMATFFVASWIEGDWPLGAAVSLAIFAAVAWAAILGCAVPMGCRRLNIDPAVVAGPFLISLSDISGVSIYILVATHLVGLG